MARTRKKEYDYFEFFCKSAQIACDAAEYLYDSLKNYDRDTFEKRLEEVHKIENRADDEKNEMLRILEREFITPIEREDIARMAHTLDDIVDDIDDVMRRVYMFNVESILPNAVSFSELIVKSTAVMKAAMEEFVNFKKSKELGELLLAIDSLETEGDRLHAKYIKELFADNNDAVTKLVWTTIYDDMEACLDNCDNAAGAISNVMLKNL